MIKCVTRIIILVALLAFQAAPAGKIRLDKVSYNFGYIGVDYNVFHNFTLYNAGDSPLTIHSVIPSCDCSITSIVDTEIAPRDSTTIRLKFNTRNWSGITDQHFTIKSDDPENPSVDVPYHSFVGQYLRGVVPDPKGLFFLPGQKSKEISILCSRYDESEMIIADQADEIFQVEIIKGEAEKDEKLLCKVTPSEQIKPGTHDSNFRIQIVTPQKEDPIFITIPVKIVRY